MIGGFWLDGRLSARPSGITFLAHGAGASANDEPVMLIMLSQGASEDAAARDRLAGEVNKMHADTVIARGGEGQDEGRLASKFRPESDEPIPTDDVPMAPWVALAYDGSVDAIAEADRVLRSVDLSSTPPLGAERGPGFQLPWISRTLPGNWRRWTLPWPGRRDRSSWVTILVSWLMMLVLAALALLIVILLFQMPLPPSGGSGGDGSGSPSMQDTSSGTSSQSGTPEDSGGHDSPTQSASMISPTTGTASEGEPSRNENLWIHD